MIVDVTSTEVHIALMENHRLIELNKESSKGHSFSVGDVYLGKVKKILPALNAAFVDIGDKKEAFVHYLDLGLYFTSFDEFVRKSNPNTDLGELYSGIPIGPILEKEGRIENVLKPGQMMIVQIVKEPISTKGSRLTAEISLAGRNIVLIPFAEKVSISQKISSKEEKRRLETLVRSILPKNYGAIIRTAAEGKNAAVLVAELKSLIEKWESSWKKVAKSKGIQLLFTEYSKTTTILRDLLNDSFSNIHVNNEAVYEEIKKYISLISPDQEKIVKLYNGKDPIFDHFEVNKIAAEEIARQLRLRDMGGIVIVDFIDMESGEHRNELHKYMQSLMESDRAKHNVLPLTKFGLMQITRQRIRPVTEINTAEVCPVCHGTGKISSSAVIDEQIERNIAYCVEHGKTDLTLKVSPILGAYLKRGTTMLSDKSFLGKWKKKYKCRINLVEVTDYTVLQNELYDEKGDRL